MKTARGDVLSNQYEEYVRITGLAGRNGVGNAMIFDTNRYSGGDKDLKGPLKNIDTGLKVNLGKVAIVSEDNDASDPDDNATGGGFRLDFARAVTFHSFDALDINAREGITLDLFGAGGTLLASFSNGSKKAKDNQFFTIATGGISGVLYAVICMSGSGAIDNIVFEMSPTDPVPLPAALPMMAMGLGGVYWARRRKVAA